jgi:hypothetical protein
LEIELNTKEKALLDLEEDLKKQRDGVEESKTKLFKHWEKYVEKNEKFK